MIWQNPWGLLALVTVALPVLIHLLGRGHARVRRFPTLRFLDPSKLLPTRRTTLQDLVLLALRVGILAAAALAVAQPFIVTAHRAQPLGDPLARAIILDTSSSMRRSTPQGERATAAARRIATQLADSARTLVVLQTAHPAAVIGGAAAWLLTQPMRGEIDVVSDFQSGTLGARDLSAIPARIGIRLARVPVRQDTTVETRSDAAGEEHVAVATPLPDRTVARWTSDQGSAISRGPRLELVAGANAQAAVDAARRAANTVSVRLPFDTTHSIAVLYPSNDTPNDVLRGATMPAQPWMTSAVARLRADSLLITAAADAVPAAAGHTSQGLVVARSAAGIPIVIAVQASNAGSDRLVLVCLAGPGTLTSAALIAAVRRAQSLAPPIAELTPQRLSDSLIASWQRAPSAVSRSANLGRDGPSDARWLWMLALVLIAVEGWWRGRERPHVA